MKLKERRVSLLNEVKEMHAAYGDSMTDDQFAEIKSKLDEVDALDVGIKAADERNGTLRRLKAMGGDDDPRTDTHEVKAASVGEHFIMHAKGALAGWEKGTPLSVSAPEYKAADDTFKRTDTLNNFEAERIRPIVNQKRERLVVADLMGDHPMSGAIIQYLVEKNKRIADGGADTVAEDGKKPYIKYDDYDLVTEAPSKIAVLTRITDEMMQDHAYVVGKINSDLVYDLSVKEEQQLLFGDGSGSNLRGVANRSGIQTLASSAFTNWSDDFYRAINMVGNATDFEADGIVINTADYEKLRLMKDSNGQYLGGGIFQGQYGQGGILIKPPLWGLNTVVTNAVPKGTAFVGAWRMGATILRKGGIRVDAANTNVDDFEHNRVTLRAEERLGLMIQIPASFVKMTLTE